MLLANTDALVASPVVKPNVPELSAVTTETVPLCDAVLVPKPTTVADVERVIRAAAGELLESLVLFDQYTGAGVPQDQRSLAWRLTFRHPERTLRDKEIEGRRSQLLKTLETQLGVRPRAS